MPCLQSGIYNWRGPLRWWPSLHGPRKQPERTGVCTATRTAVLPLQAAWHAMRTLAAATDIRLLYTVGGRPTLKNKKEAKTLRGAKRYSRPGIFLLGGGAIAPLAPSGSTPLVGPRASQNLISLISRQNEQVFRRSFLCCCCTACLELFARCCLQRCSVWGRLCETGEVIPDELSRLHVDLWCWIGAIIIIRLPFHINAEQFKSVWNFLI